MRNKTSTQKRYDETWRELSRKLSPPPDFIAESAGMMVALEGMSEVSSAILESCAGRPIRRNSDLA